MISVFLIPSSITNFPSGYVVYILVGVSVNFQISPSTVGSYSKKDELSYNHLTLLFAKLIVFTVVLVFSGKKVYV